MFCFGRKVVCDKEQRVIGAAVSLRAKSPAQRLQREYIERFVGKILMGVPAAFSLKNVGGVGKRKTTKIAKC